MVKNATKNIELLEIWFLEFFGLFFINWVICNQFKLFES